MSLDTLPWVAGPQPVPGAGAEEPTVLLHGVRLPRTGPADAVAHATDHLAQHLARVGARPRGTAALVDLVERAGLTGHGGAHVPAGVKWRAALRSHGPLTVVANAAESEPISAKDATLLRQRPHLVLDGLALLAEALGAVRAVVWLHADDLGTRAAVREALDERRIARAAEPWLEIVVGPGHYLAGESSAIAQALAGGPALPALRRRDDTATRPRALVHNAETLARLALLARGYPPVPTVLLTVLTPRDRQVLEVERGTPMADVLGATGWLNPPPQAVLLGGFGGMWASWRDLARTTVDEAVLRTVGLSLGAGVVAPIPAGACGVVETAAVAEYLASASARQCGPCLFGLPAIADSVRRFADGTAGRGERVRLLDDLQAVTGRGACHHPDGATRLVASALAVFGADMDRHARGRRCAGAHWTTLPVPGATP